MKQNYTTKLTCRPKFVCIALACFHFFQNYITSLVIYMSNLSVLNDYYAESLIKLIL